MTAHDVATVTEAQRGGESLMVVFKENATRSSLRTRPYIELYQGRTSIMETPIQHRQKAAKDEERRKSAH